MTKTEIEQRIANAKDEKTAAYWRSRLATTTTQVRVLHAAGVSQRRYKLTLRSKKGREKIAAAAREREAMRLLSRVMERAD